MTDALSPRAAAVLDDYLEQVRTLMRKAGLDADEVESDIRDHVFEATAGGEAPVDADEMESVLRGLGAPHHWVLDKPMAADPGRSPHAEVKDDLRLLAPAVLVVTLSGIAAFPWIGPLGLLISWILARAAVARTRAAGRHLGPWRWFVLPPLIVVASGLAGFLLVAPLGPLSEVSLNFPRWVIVVGGLVAWYGLIGFLAWVFRRAVRWLLFPLLSFRSEEWR